MYENLFIIKNHSQIRELSSLLKVQILNELMQNVATCQQLANIFGISKQKVHYNLQGLLSEGLICIDESITDSAKEVYYRARAKNYIFDFSLGAKDSANNINHRDIMQTILEKDYNISLEEVAGNLIDNSLNMKPKERLLIVTGEYNLPLVNKLIVEAAKRQIETTVKYQNTEFLDNKYNKFSLSAFTADYENFNKYLRTHDVYLNLNGEARYIPVTDPIKIEIQQKAFEKSREIIKNNRIKVAMMPGLSHETLSENAILTEINYWNAIHIDYNRLAEETNALNQQLLEKRVVRIEQQQTTFEFEVQSTFCEYGSFTDSEFQSPIINLPGGEILIVPRSKTVSGTVTATVGYAFGERIENPKISFRDGKIESFSSATNGDLIEKAIMDGGKDGHSVALICLGTNFNVGLEHIDASYKSKGKGVLSIIWGENQSFGGTVAGKVEWFITLEDYRMDLVN